MALRNCRSIHKQTASATPEAVALLTSRACAASLVLTIYCLYNASSKT